MRHFAKFNLGDVVLHKKQGYRAVIVDVDPLFHASGRYNPQTQKRTFAHQNPWYRLLVDETRQMTYVEEPLLLADPEMGKKHINNPLLKKYNHTQFH